MQWLPAGKIRPTARRRQLAFARLAEVMPDVEPLLARHLTVGRWTLGQICNHLGTTICMSMDGTPEKAPWLLRRTAGVLLRHLTLWRGRIPEGVRVPEVYLPRPELDATREAGALRSAIERFTSFRGTCDEHPLLGRMTHEQWERFHCIHAAHHLSFAVPLEPSA
jgi:hypothetical protein